MTTTTQTTAAGPPWALGADDGSRLRIGVDFDGVLFDHIPWILRGFRDTYGIDLAGEGLHNWDMTRYRAVQENGLTWDCVRRVLRTIETDPGIHESPLKDAYARGVIERWRADGHIVEVVTARQPESRAVTQQFLKRNRIPHDALRMGVQRKTGYDILVDDAPHNVLLTAEGGGLALVMDHPYNRLIPEMDAIRRVQDWMDVEHEVLAALLPRLVPA